jgi:hypothetical protein
MKLKSIGYCSCQLSSYQWPWKTFPSWRANLCQVKPTNRPTSRLTNNWIISHSKTFIGELGLYKDSIHKFSPTVGLGGASVGRSFNDSDTLVFDRDQPEQDTRYRNNKIFQPHPWIVLLFVYVKLMKILVTGYFSSILQ